MIPKRYEHFLTKLLISGMMSCMVSGLVTLRNVGFVDDYFARWGSAWMMAWSIAYPAILFVSPLAQKATSFLVRD